MREYSLNGVWKFRMLQAAQWNREQEKSYPVPEEWIDATVPGSMYQAYLEAGVMEDPYYRDRELKALPLSERDYEYQRSFSVTEEQLSCENILLSFEGIDTLGEIYLNDRLLGETCNMHVRYEYPVKEILREGKNTLRVVLYSPVNYIRGENQKLYTGGVNEAMEGYPHLRKAHCMFGWDWGARLPDLGIFRDVKLLCYRGARLQNVSVAQEHIFAGEAREPGQIPEKVRLRVRWEIEDKIPGRAYACRVKVTAPDGETKICNLDAPSKMTDVSYTKTRMKITESEITKQEVAELEITEPELWWPNGYGGQPLYMVRLELLEGSGEPTDGEQASGRQTGSEPTDDEQAGGEQTSSELTAGEQAGGEHTGSEPTDGDQMIGEKTDSAQAILDIWERRIGLRTMTVDRKKDEWGECFAHQINGLDIFAMGADYIPEDNLMGRLSRARTERLLRDCAAANHNVIRIWGGGYYPDDYFYDICDELGLVVWQDFMFACSAYELDDAFEENIAEEITQNIRRIRHHACLGLWCGNNEMETQTLEGSWRPSPKQKADYIKMFDYMIPRIVREEDPQSFYWPSSPSSGGNFDNPWDENRGDTHYWDVWHGCKPFTDYRKYHFRYLSEFGFQSFPCLKTVESYTEPEDRNIFSRVMEMHQRNRAANGKILDYLSQTFRYPTSFDRLLYASQLLQMEAIRYGVEHFRRHRGRCMGAVVWQLNDIWPVASWSSIDYFGRWKALHYAERRMFAPVMISCEETGELSERPYCIMERKAPIELAARLHVANETWETVEGTVRWELRRPDASVILQGEEEVSVEPFSGVWLPKLDFSGQDELACYISYRFERDGRIVSQGSSLFTAPKHFRFEDPRLALRVDGDVLTVAADKYARSVEIAALDGDVRFSDNYFDLNGDSLQVRIMEGSATRFAVRSVYDIGREM